MAENLASKYFPIKKSLKWDKFMQMLRPVPLSVKSQKRSDLFFTLMSHLQKPYANFEEAEVLHS